MGNREQRNTSFDLIRTIAIIFVICIHSMGTLNEIPRNNITLNLIISIYNCIIYSGVPLFVMLSGALLLEKEERVILFFRKRFQRVLIPFIIWSLIVFILQMITEKKDFQLELLEDFFSKLFFDGVHGIYWYIYMLLGLYILTPVLRILLKYSGEKLSLYAILFLLIVVLLGKTSVKVFQ